MSQYSTVEGTKHQEQTQRTREFIEALFTKKEDWDRAFPAALSDDLIWTTNGSSPISGRYTSKQDYVDRVLKPMHEIVDKLPAPTVKHTFVDGYWAVVHWRCEGVKAKNGANYDQDYCWLLRTNGQAENKIVEILSWFDPNRLSAALEGTGVTFPGAQSRIE
ncbi:uncharacterized protein A1O9_01692 [Exophiala aquamarina CBS 119918]|uniref:SnoaL-like domain-containing protein n=1 Tax=Exophiala aquamarina CBS 119918 TaxID=1182545 RepID=A0A072PUF0_9EURO|nr:uncharacterized protein A1O9_01692 [Exophiala aquamarina CBS 119918]KEF63714.1 hypothetical protein A1O9_01692 [Exophiala aquamarina CBS 119918]